MNTNTILLELLEFFSQAELAKKLDLSPTQISQFVSGCKDCTDEQILGILAFFDEHVEANSVEIPVANLNQMLDSSILVSTPDGWQGVKTFFTKKPREILKISTKNHNLKCSTDHLVETDFGWILAKDLSEGLNLVTKNGLEATTSIQKLEVMPVFDFEVMHENSRYWAGSGISSHNSGKSFLLGNIIKAAQSDGAFILALDSENALDHDYLKKIGVNVEEEHFLGMQVVTISDVITVVSDFIKSYEKEYGKYNKNAPKVIIALDSLDMLLTDTENSHFDEGVQKGDQGQRAKQMKAFLRTTVSRIKALNISFIGTHQVYPADVMQGEGKWAVNNAIRYSASQIILITKLKLKEDGVVSGIRMSCETFKSRFAKLGSKVEVNVPYNTGMNPFSGLLDLLEAAGVISKAGAWLKCTFPGEKEFSFQSTKMNQELADKLLSHPKLQSEATKLEELFATPETPEEIGLADPGAPVMVDNQTGEILIGNGS